VLHAREKRESRTQAMTRPQHILESYKDHYEALLARLADLQRTASPEAVLTWIEGIARFAAMHHAGRFADGAIENALLECGRRLPGDRAGGTGSARTAAPRRERRRVLHVATIVSQIGGHTKTILNWILKDTASEHSLVLTTQGNASIPSSLAAAIVATGGRIVVLPEREPLLSKASHLRRVAQSSADLAVLHLAPHDVVPIVAFASAGGIPVAQVNLADHCFWLGSSVADMVIHQREIGLTTSRVLRFSRNDCVLPIPMMEDRPDLSRVAARRELGIPDGQVVLLSVGRSLKYAPTERHNFFRAAATILERHPNAHLYLVGVGEADHMHRAGFVRHERLTFVGPIEDVASYQRAADVYLEGFPFGSQTALLESILPGNPCVQAHAPGSPLLATDDFALTDLVTPPPNEATYIARAGELIDNPEERARLGNLLRERVIKFHISGYWIDQLNSIYSRLEQLEHNPRDLPVVHGSVRPVDVAISEYHSAHIDNSDSPAGEALIREVYRDLLGSAYSLRNRGCHLDAFRYVRIAADDMGWTRDALSYALKLPAHYLFYHLWRRSEG
jgi:glycosyltransferase involved in cell wall biosynthesis